MSCCLKTCLWIIAVRTLAAAARLRVRLIQASVDVYLRVEYCFIKLGMRLSVCYHQVVH